MYEASNTEEPCAGKPHAGICEGAAGQPAALPRLTLKRKLDIQTIWSTDLNPPLEGLPSDTEDFEIFMQVSLGESGKPGGEVFSFTVTSPSALSKTESNRFISHTLVLDSFDWMSIQRCLEKLIRHAASCKNWDEAIKSLSGYLKYSDE